MIIAKVVSHRDLERQVVMALEEFGLFEFIDVRQQAGLSEIKRSREEETVFSVFDRCSNLVTFLKLDVQRRSAVPIDIDDTSLSGSLDYVGGVIKSVEPEALELQKNIASAGLEFDRQRSTRDVAVSLKPLGLDLSRIGTTEYTFTTAGVLPTTHVTQLQWSLSEVTEGAFAFRSIAVRKGVSVASVIIPVDRKPAVERILSALGFEAFEVPEKTSGRPDDIVQSATERMAELKHELDELESKRKSMADEWNNRIVAAWEILKIERKRIEIKTFFAYTEHSVKAWGWIPEGSEERLESLLRERVGTALDVKFDRPDFAEEESPTYLTNPSYMKTTEGVVTAYGVPSRHDLDPTKIMFLSFPLIFGFVFSDVGQGFIILLIGLAAWRSVRKGQNWGSTMGYLQAGAQGLMMLGVFAMLGGLLFGSFFGSDTVIQPIWPLFAHTLSDGTTNPYRSAHMLKLSIEIGALHITSGILLNLYNKIKHHSYRDAVAAFSYLWMYLGFVNLVFGVSYNSVSSWFNSTGAVHLWIPILGLGHGTGNNGIYPLLPVSPFIFTIVMFIAPFIVMAISSAMGGMEGIVIFLENAIGTISHTVSYARIFALNTVHMILSTVFMSLPAIYMIYFPPVSILGISIIPAQVWTEGVLTAPHMPLLGALLGSIIVGMLEGVIAFLQTLRLHFVEWFSKFYHAGGVAFAPYHVSRLHTLSSKAVSATETHMVT
jgi:V/A-type H+-transporting ATPase subunit I